MGLEVWGESVRDEGSDMREGGWRKEVDLVEENYVGAGDLSVGEKVSREHEK